MATSSNIGSVMSVTGNPQNALVGISAHFSFLGFLGHLAPLRCSACVSTWRCWPFFFETTFFANPWAPGPDQWRSTRSGFAEQVLSGGGSGGGILWILGYSFPLVAISVGAFILVIGRVKAENIYQRIDWELLLFFASLFVVVHGFQRSGAVDYLIARFPSRISKARFASQLFAVSGMMLILSNLVSNVPAVLLFRPLVPSFPNSHFIWLVVASTSTLAGTRHL